MLSRAREAIVTKRQIVRTIAHKTGLPPADIQRIVQETFDAVIDVLERDGRLELRNFGVFQVKSRAARRARNPATGEEVAVPDRLVVSFKPGLIMQQRIAAIEPSVVADWSDRVDHGDECDDN